MPTQSPFPMAGPGRRAPGGGREGWWTAALNTPPPFLFLASNKVGKGHASAPGLSQGDPGFQ